MRGGVAWFSLAFVIAACAPPSGEPHGSRGADEAHGAPDTGHGAAPNVVKLSAEAAELAGVRVATAERRAITGGASIPAEVQFEPNATAHVAPLVPGRITRVEVSLGDEVQRGQTLGVISSSDVSDARARLNQTQAQLRAAESARSRQEDLSAEGIGARRSLIEAEAQVSELRAAVEGLRRQLEVLGSGRGGELTLVSPIDGVVVAVHATLGETASPDRAAFIVSDPNKLWVQGYVPELTLREVQVGAAVVVRLDAYPELSLAGTITYAAPAIDETTRSLPIRVQLAEPDPRLRSGLFGSVELVDGGADGRVLTVPTSAIATLEGQTVVFVPTSEPHAFRPQPVVLGRRAGGYFEVRSGLEEGQRIAVSGGFTLKSTLESDELAEGHAD